MKWTGCDHNTSVTVEGDFLLRLWEWDARLTVDNESRILESGMRNPESIPEDTVDVTPVAGRGSELYIRAYNATITVPGPTGNYEVYLKQARAEAEGGFTLSGASGSFLGLDLNGQDVYAKGDDLTLELSGTGTGRPIQTRTSGVIEKAEVDGAPIPIPSTQAVETTGPKPHWGLLGLALAGVIALVGAGIWRGSPAIRNRVRGIRLRAMEMRFDEALVEANDFNMDRPKRAQRWARRALRLRPNHPEALAALGLSYKGQKKYEKALPCFENAIFTMDTNKPPELEGDIIAFWATDAARCLGRMRFKTTDLERREMLTEKILNYARLAWNVDKTVAQDLLNDGVISDLRDSLGVMFSLSRHGVHT